MAVLIIGILAAVAVPQYQMAVDKSRVIQVLQVAMNIRQAQEAYYMANGHYATLLSDLDIDYSRICNQNDGSNIYCDNNTIIIDNIVGVVAANPNESAHRVGIRFAHGSDREIYISVYFNYSSNPNEIICQSDTERGTRLCNALHLQ